jgi:putative transposase
MKRKKYTTEQIIGILKACDASGNVSGSVVSTASRTPPTTGGRPSTGIWRFPMASGELELQNTKLKRLLSEEELDKAALKDLLGRKW